MLKKTIFCVLCILSCSACVVPGVKDSMQNSQNGLVIGADYTEIQPSNATLFHGASVVGNPSQSLNQQQTHKKIRQSNSWFGSSSVNYGNSWFAE